jgi:hypothetical protein
MVEIDGAPETSEKNMLVVLIVPLNIGKLVRRPRYHYLVASIDAPEKYESLSPICKLLNEEIRILSKTTFYTKNGPYTQDFIANWDMKMSSLVKGQQSQRYNELITKTQCRLLFSVCQYIAIQF